MSVTQALRKTLMYKADATAAQIYADVAEMREFDRENEKLQSMWGWIGGLAILIALASFIGLVVTEGESPLPYAGLAFGVVTAIVGFFIRSRYAKFNLEDLRYEFLRELVRLLKTDMREEDTFHVKLSFRRHNHRNHFERKGHASGWKVKFYKHPWITVKGRLLDGARFEVSLIEKQQDRHKTKQSRSGKYKMKYKTKNAAEMIVVLRFKPKRYPLFAGNQAAIEQALQLPQGAELKALEVTEQSIKIQVKTGPGFEIGKDDAKAKQRVQLATSLLLSCYHILNQSRRAAG